MSRGVETLYKFCFSLDAAGVVLKVALGMKGLEEARTGHMAGTQMEIT